MRSPEELVVLQGGAGARSSELVRRSGGVAHAWAAFSRNVSAGSWPFLCRGSARIEGLFVAGGFLGLGLQLQQRSLYLLGHRGWTWNTIQQERGVIARALEVCSVFGREIKRQHQRGQHIRPSGPREKNTQRSKEKLQVHGGAPGLSKALRGAPSSEMYTLTN